MTHEEFKNKMMNNNPNVKHYMQAYDDLSQIQQTYKAATDKKTDDLNEELNTIHSDLMSTYNNALEVDKYSIIVDLATLLRKQGFRLAAIPTTDLIDRKPSELTQKLHNWSATTRSSDMENAPVGTYMHTISQNPEHSEFIFQRLQSAIDGEYTNIDAIKALELVATDMIEMLYESGQISITDCEVIHHIVQNLIIWTAESAQLYYSDMIESSLKQSVSSLIDQLLIKDDDDTGIESDTQQSE